jgi:hypothetical protein
LTISAPALSQPFLIPQPLLAQLTRRENESFDHAQPRRSPFTE